MPEQREVDETVRKIRQFWAAGRGRVAVAIVLVAVILFLAVPIWTGKLQTGFDAYTPAAPGTQRAKTSWDLMDLLLVPLVLAIGAGLFTWATNRREQEAEERTRGARFL